MTTKRKHHVGETAIELRVGEESADVEVRASGELGSRVERADGRVIAHAPKWIDGYHDEQVDLERTYLDALREATDLGKRSLGVSLLRTAADDFPDEPAALIAFGTVARFVAENPEAFDAIILSAPSEEAEVYERAFEEFVATMQGTP